MTTDLTTDLHGLDNYASQMLTDLQTGRLTADMATDCIMSLGPPDLPPDLPGKASMLTELADRLATSDIDSRLASLIADLMLTADLANILADSDLTDLPADRLKSLADAVARI